MDSLKADVQRMVDEMSEARKKLFDSFSPEQAELFVAYMGVRYAFDKQLERRIEQCEQKADDLSLKVFGPKLTRIK